MRFPRMRLFRPRRLLESASQGHADQRTAVNSVPAAGQAAGQRVPSISRGQVSQIVDARNSWHVMSSNKVKEHCCARTTSRHSRTRHSQTLHDGLSLQPDISAWHDQALSIPLPNCLFRRPFAFNFFFLFKGHIKFAFLIPEATGVPFRNLPP